MSNHPQPHRLERIRYWQGQRLHASDLQSQIDHVDQLRWWHNRMHDAFGVAEGMKVRLAEDGNSVLVSPGVAYDAFGRELFLFEETAVYLPDPTGVEQLLLASFQDAVGALPHLYWKPSAWFSAHDGAILARQTATGALRAGKLARADKRPFIAYGATIPGKTNWSIWPLANLPNQTCDGDASIVAPVEQRSLRLTVNTSSSGFVHTPHYFATVQGDPGIPLMMKTFIACPTPTEFTLFVYDRVDLDKMLAAFQDNNVWVSWLGLEPMPDQGATE